MSFFKNFNQYAVFGYLFFRHNKLKESWESKNRKINEKPTNLEFLSILEFFQNLQFFLTVWQSTYLQQTRNKQKREQEKCNTKLMVDYGWYVKSDSISDTKQSGKLQE